MYSGEILRVLSSDEKLGAGNFLWIALKASADITHRFIKLSAHDQKRWELAESYLSLTDLEILSKKAAIKYHSLGVEVGDKVAIYATACFDYFIHYIALTSLGAIPIWINGKLPEEIALKYILRSGAIRVVTNQDRLADASLSQNSKTTKTDIDSFISSIHEEDADAIMRLLPTNYPHEHKDNDVVIVCHSSGTTGFPKPVAYRHKAMMYGIKQFLYSPQEFVSWPTVTGHPRFLSLLPCGHHASLTYFMRATLAGIVFFPACPGDDHQLTGLIGEFKPTSIISFPCHYAALYDYQDAELEEVLITVSWWLSVGDIMHKRHISRLTGFGQIFKGSEFTRGSIFIDGLGSSEMGSIFFRALHEPGMALPVRYIGKPQPWITARVFDHKSHTEVPRGTIGRLGVSSPTLADYWKCENRDSASWIDGSFLTGDLVYEDDNGFFYHVDRTTDAISTRQGLLYSALTEAVILENMPEIRECTVIGVPEDKNAEFSKTILYACLHGTVDKSDAVLQDVNRFLTIFHIPQIDEIRIIDRADLPKGITGKVRKIILREASYEPR
jgi:acyl-coenzyme A synthetase/AMP-(fatty) acid ligase